MSNSVNLSLDVTKTGIQNPLIKVRQGDGGFETLHTTVTSNGEPLDLQGWTITFMGTTAGNHKIVDANVKVVEAPNGIFDYTPSKAWGMDIGDFKMAYFKFVKGDGSASSANFRVSVIEAVDLTQDEAKNYISVVDATIADVRQRLTSSLASVTASVAATSSAASSMAVYVSRTASSAVSQVSSAASSASSVASSAADKVSGVAAQVNSLSIGGRNLFLNSKSLWSVSGNAGASYTIEDYDPKTKMWHITAPAGNTTGSTGIYFSQPSNSSTSFVSGDKWVMSIDVKGSGYMTRFGLQKSSIISNSGNVPSNWTRMSSSGVMNGTSTDVVIYFDVSNVPLDVYIKLPKLERGNIATDWTPAPEDADNTYVKKSGDTMTSGLTVGGDPTQGGSGTMIKQNGGIELGASTAFIDFHGQNSTQDYTSRIYDDTTFAGAKAANLNSGNGASALLNTLVLSSNRSFNLDTLALTVDGVNYGMTLIDANIAFSNRSQITAPTLPSDMTSFEIDYGIVRYRVGPNFGWVDMEMTNFWNNTTWKRTKRSGVWQPWIKIANDYNVVHNTGNETVAGDKTFTGVTNIQNQKQYKSSFTIGANTINLTRIGSIVYVNARIKEKINAGASYGVIPAGFTPANNAVISFIVNNIQGSCLFQADQKNVWFPADAPFDSNMSGSYLTSDALPS